MELPRPFASQSFEARLEATRAKLQRLDLDALLITSLANVRWLTGFSGSNARVIISPETFSLVTDSRYATSAEVELLEAGSAAELFISKEFGAASFVSSLGGFRRVGVESTSLSWASFNVIRDAVPDTEIVATSGLCEELRRTKDPGERNLLAFAASLADTALGNVAGNIKPGCSERSLAAQLNFQMRLLGADGPAYDTIVASGPNSALPHAVASDRLLESGDLLIIDVGARVQGYGSDMTRTFVVGTGPSAEQRRWYDAVVESQRAGVAALVDGEPEHLVDAACRAVLVSHGLEDNFTHGTGHGIGLDIHEDPILSSRSSGNLHAGLVITVEPGIYFPSLGGVRIEDAVAMSEDEVEILTKCPKDLDPRNI